MDERVRSRGFVDVREGDGEISLTPYDLVSEGQECPPMPQEFVHRATLTFGEPGVWRVPVRGRPTRGGAVVATTREIVIE